ncbi:hypothetical protein RHSIM_Rhsim08G0005700 [Rhododendron simsii]|uniref:Uncharacterized protein n=1 Tax=Rhododendron simsii TaxID=118357 RepID=A0A834GIF1_RHOSS|nr:hypothetical protein RHSIM_Rhsim08G0005700 [Rhododendron simsii]
MVLKAGNDFSLTFQLRICKGISYAAVAAHADKSGRRKLAAMFISLNMNHILPSREVSYSLGFDPCLQVPLLLSIGEEDNALTRQLKVVTLTLFILFCFINGRRLEAV